MWRSAICLGVLLVVLAGPVGAQSTQDCLSNTLGVNRVTSGVNLTIGATAVKVVEEDLKRCQLVIVNTGGAPITCLPVWQGVATPTTGVQIAGPGQLQQGTSGRGAWWCIASTGTPSVALILEELPNVP